MLTRITMVLLLLNTLNAIADNSKYSLTEKLMFENEIDGHECERLVVNGKSISWVSDVTEVSHYLVYRICEQENPSEKPVDGRVVGGVKNGWYKMDRNSQKVTSVVAPKLIDFSNPSYCGIYIAYWGNSGEREWFGTIYDLEHNKLVKSVSLGKFELETDYMYHLKQASWSSDCKSVIFDDDRHIKKKILTIQ